MRGLMLDYQLTIPAMLRRAEQLFGSKAIVTRLPDKSFHRYTYAVLRPPGQAGLPRPAPRSRQPSGRPVPGAGHPDRRRPHHLAGHPPGAGPESGPLGPLQPAGHGGRRVGGPAGHDPGLPGTPRPAGRPRLGHDGDDAPRHRVHPHPRTAGGAGGRPVRLPGETGSTRPLHRDPGPQRPGPGPLGRADHGRAGDPRSLGGVGLLRGPGGGRSLDGRRLAPHGRHRHHRPPGLHRDQGPRQGPGEVGRRVDQLGGPGERAHGPPGRGGGRGDRRPAPQVAGAPAGRGGAQAGAVGHQGRAARLPAPQVRQVVAAGRHRVRRPDPPYVHGEVPQAGPARALPRPPHEGDRQLGHGALSGPRPRPRRKE